MRFCKHTIGSVEATEQEEEKKYKLIFRFHYALISPLFSHSYTTLPIIARIPVTQVDKMNTIICQQRPQFRRNKTVVYGFVEIYLDYTLQSAFFVESPVCNEEKEKTGTNTVGAALMEIKTEDVACKCIRYLRVVCNLLSSGSSWRNDYVLPPSPSSILSSSSPLEYCYKSRLTEMAPTYCVELKPKQGWIPFSDRRIKCTFCMNQYLKLADNRIKYRTDYCPLDLFSGEPSRIKYAIKCLLKSPQNNLKIFKQDKLIYGEEVNSDYITILKEWFDYQSSEEEAVYRVVEKFSGLITNVLLYNNTVTKDCNSITTITNANMETYVKKQKFCLIQTDKMDEINRVMKTSSTACNWSYITMPNNCILNNILNVQKLDKAGLETAYEYHRLYLNSVPDSSYAEQLVASIMGDENFSHTVVNIPALNVAERYSLAAAANDCSIFITLRKINPLSFGPIPVSEQHIIQYSEMEQYQFNILIGDIGPKPMSCIPKHWRRDTDILNSCFNYFCTN